MRHFNRESLDYDFTAKYLAGLVLEGAQAKSLRISPPQFRNSRIEVINGLPVLLNLYIPPYKFAAGQVVNTSGQINLLMSQKEIKQLQSYRNQKYMIVPIAIFPKGRWLKLEVGVGRKLRKYEKREKIKARDLARESK